MPSDHKQTNWNVIPVEREDPNDFVVKLRKRVDRFVHNTVVELFVLLMIAISVMLMLIEIVLDDPMHAALAADANMVITWFFIVELSVRYWVARNKSRYFRTYWLDILSVLPVIRPLRVFRVFRILRLLRAGRLVNRRMGDAEGPATEISSLIAVTLTLVLAAAMVLYDAERHLDNTAFPDFETALWFSVLSLVGGEPIGAQPATLMGRWTTLFLMIGGLTVFGLFVATITGNMVSRLSGGLGLHEIGIDELREHIVVCGWNGSGPTVVRELFGPSNPDDRAVVVVTEGPEPPADMPRDGVRAEHLYTLQGDYTRIDVLTEAGIHHCTAAILLADGTQPRSDQDRDARTVLAALTVERLVPGIFTVAELTNRDNESLLRLAGVEEIVVGDWYAGMVLGSATRNRGLVQILDEVLTTSRGNAFHTSVVPAKFDGVSVGALHTTLFEEHSAVLISVEKDGQVDVNPDHQATLTAGDPIVVLSKAAIEW